MSDGMSDAYQDVETEFHVHQPDDVTAQRARVIAAYKAIHTHLPSVQELDYSSLVKLDPYTVECLHRLDRQAHDEGQRERITGLAKEILSTFEYPASDEAYDNHSPKQAGDGTARNMVVREIATWIQTKEDRAISDLEHETAALRARYEAAEVKLDEAVIDRESLNTQLTLLQDSDKAYAAASTDNVNARLQLAKRLAEVEAQRNKLSLKLADMKAWKEDWELEVKEHAKTKQQLLEAQRDLAASQAVTRILDEERNELTRLRCQLTRMTTEWDERQGPRIELAGSAVVDYLSSEIDELLPLLGVESALITDMSTVDDFPDKQLGAEKYIWQAAIDVLRSKVPAPPST